jgi:nitroreductase
VADDPLHALLRGRWSPRVFDPAEVTTAELDALLEAARWAPSAGNSQPWSVIAGRRGDDVHARLVRHLAGSSARWAPAAGLLVGNVCHRYVEGTDWEYSEFAMYDLGQAVAHMTLQAQAMGLGARQFAAFDRDAVTREFGVPDHLYVATMTAFGRVPDWETPHAAVKAGGEVVPRDRRPAGDLQWPGR